MMMRPENDGGAYENIISDFEIPDTLAKIFKYERSERRKLFGQLHEKLGKFLEAFGDKETTQSFHSVPLESGRKFILHSLEDHSSIGPCHHIIVNQESGDNLQVSYTEFALPDNFNSLGFASAEMRRESASRGWFLEEIGKGALLIKQNDSFTIIRGPDSAMVLPPIGWYPEISEAQHMLVTIQLRSLLAELEPISPGTYDENVTGYFQ